MIASYYGYEADLANLRRRFSISLKGATLAQLMRHASALHLSTRPFRLEMDEFCPSCNTRRMAEAAAHLTDHVFPRLPVRQWVLSVPKRLRYYLQRDKGALNAALCIFLRVVQQSLQSHCPGAAQCDPTSLHLGAVALHPPLWLQPEHPCALPCVRGRWGV